MDTLVEKFLDQGAIGPTRKSHRTFARAVRTFLVNNILQNKPDRLVLSTEQDDDLEK